MRISSVTLRRRKRCNMPHPVANVWTSLNWPVAVRQSRATCSSLDTPCIVYACCSSCMSSCIMRDIGQLMCSCRNDTYNGKCMVPGRHTQHIVHKSKEAPMPETARSAHSFRYNTTRHPACDGRTDGQTCDDSKHTALYMYSTASRSKMLDTQ